MFTVSKVEITAYGTLWNMIITTTTVCCLNGLSKSINIVLLLLSQTVYNI